MIDSARGGVDVGIADRRKKIIKILSQRGHETIMNLAFEFGVSERTIRRDIEFLSLTEPIYTQTGRYAGGIYLYENHFINRIYFSDEEEDVIKKAYSVLNMQMPKALSEEELHILQRIVASYSKPKRRKENKNEGKRKTII